MVFWSSLPGRTTASSSRSLWSHHVCILGAYRSHTFWSTITISRPVVSSIFSIRNVFPMSKQPACCQIFCTTRPSSVSHLGPVLALLLRLLLLLLLLLMLSARALPPGEATSAPLPPWLLSLRGVTPVVEATRDMTCCPPTKPLPPSARNWKPRRREVSMPASGEDTTTGTSANPGYGTSTSSSANEAVVSLSRTKRSMRYRFTAPCPL
jgi:hypothetical protein